MQAHEKGKNVGATEFATLYRKNKSKCVINPEGNAFLRRWDCACASILLFVCFVTPFEVAFLETELNAMFWLNRAVDCIFVVDIILQFFVMQEIRNRYGSTFIVDQRKIIKRYVKGWFVIDLLSVLPYDTLALQMQSGGYDKLKLLRTVRLLRLVKLVRLLRGLRMFQRWAVELSFSYRRLTLAKLLVGVVVAAHWIACILGLVASLEAGTDECELWQLQNSDISVPDDCVTTWSTRALLLAHSEEDGPITPLERYLVSLHTSVTFIVHPHAHDPMSDGERVAFTIILLWGGFIWTNIISRSTAISTSLDRHNIFHHQTMDDLNAISDDLRLSSKLRRRLREFFTNTKDSSQRTTWNSLTARMSPQLRAEVAREVNRAWVRRVPYLAGASWEMVVDISQQLVPQMYAQKESFGTAFTMYILHRGMVSKGDDGLFVRRPGAVWGEEHLLLNVWWLLEPTASMALTFCETLVISRRSFEQIAADHPENEKHLRKYYIKYCLWRGVRYEARRRIKEAKANGQRPASKDHQETTGSPRLGDDLDGMHGRLHIYRIKQEQRQIQRGLTGSLSVGKLTTSMSLTPASLASVDRPQNEMLEIDAERSFERNSPGLSSPAFGPAQFGPVMEQSLQRCQQLDPANVEEIEDRISKRVMEQCRRIERRLAGEIDQIRLIIEELPSKLAASAGPPVPSLRLPAPISETGGENRERGHTASSGSRCVPGCQMMPMWPSMPDRTSEK